MTEQAKLYIAGVGTITSIGANTAMTAAAVKAGVSGYSSTEYSNQQGLPITMASVPDMVFDEVQAEIIDGDRFNARHDRVIKMAIVAIREACMRQTAKQPAPLVLAMPEGQSDDERLSPFIPNLEHNCKPWVSTTQSRSIHSGRAAGIEAIDFAFRYLHDLPNEFILIGGSDSYRDYSRLTPLAESDRLLVAGNRDGFAPGEAAGFLLLTRHAERALARNGNVIAVNPPGIAEEPGHLYSKETYRGDGLDQAFKKALVHHSQATIHSIYSSMNGENHWAKEYGVAHTRNRASFRDPVKVEHPADCYGDLGAATGPVLIALATEHLFNNANAKAHLVYSSSDRGKRGAIVLEKISIAKDTASADIHRHLANS